jgi:L-rhamnose mutarotase
MQYVFFLDLINDSTLIAEYEAMHLNVWPEVEQQIHNSGVEHCEIFRFENRLVLIVEAPVDMDWEEKGKADAQHEPTQQWESLMWKYQQSIPGFEGKGKWQLAKNIYTLKK